MWNVYDQVINHEKTREYNFLSAGGLLFFFYVAEKIFGQMSA